MSFLALLVVLNAVLLITLASRAVTIKGSLVTVMAPLVEFRFHRLRRPAILLGDMSNERVAIASVSISLAASFFLCFVLTRFILCSHSCITFLPVIEPTVFASSCCSVL
jgi:hypothetical protein